MGLQLFLGSRATNLSKHVIRDMLANQNVSILGDSSMTDTPKYEVLLERRGGCTEKHVRKAQISMKPNLISPQNTISDVLRPIAFEEKTSHV